MTANGTFEILDVDACLELLATQQVGRLAFLDEGEIVVLPVNYLLDRGTVLVRTAEGSKLDAAVRGERVAFEVDDVDPIDHTGWSVLVKGRCAEIWEGTELDTVRRLPLESWAAGEKAHYLTVLPSAITGRRLAAAPREGAADRWWG